MLTVFSIGCAFSTPMKGPGYDPKNRLVTEPSSNETVVIALTHAVLNPKTRKPFDRYVSELVRTIESNPGYIAGRFRKEVFGNQAWTYTVWRDKESLMKFAMGAKHLDAMYMSHQGLEKFRTGHKVIPVKELPISWEEIENKFKDLEIKKHEGI